MLRAWRRSALAALAVAATASGAAVALAQVDGTDFRARQLPSGRRLQPQGRTVALGAYPVGAQPTPDGRFYWAVSIYRRRYELRVVNLAGPTLVQTLELPGATGGLAMDATRRRGYVAGPDAVRAYTWNARSGRVRLAAIYRLPRPPDRPADNPRRPAFAGRLAVAPDGRRLLVPLAQAGEAAVVDVRTRRTTYVPTGSHPYGAAVLRGGRVGLVSNEAAGTVSVIDLRRGRKLRDVQVGANRSHPLGIAVDPRADRAYVAVAHADQVAVLDTRRLRVQRTLSVGRPQGLGTMPVDVATSRDGSYLMAVEAGADEIAVFHTPTAARGSGARFRRAGRVPVGDYPVAVAAAPVARPGCAASRRSRGARLPRATTARCERLVWLATKGFGSTANPFGPNPYRSDAANGEQAPGQIVIGVAGALDFPTDRRLRALEAVASRQVRPANPESAPAGTPLRAGGPIQHVFFIVRENRTYDQVLGDDPRGNGDPQLTLFGSQITPNAHALVARFPLLDDVLANSEVSTDGHLWTTAAAVSDYVQRNWMQVFNPAGRPDDAFLSVRWPAGGFLFDQADRQGVSYFNFGESIAGTVEVPDPDLSAADAAARARRAARSDLGPPAGCYSASIYVSRPSNRPVWDSAPVPGAPDNVLSRFQCFQAKFRDWVARGQVPALTYMILPEDHTQGITPDLLTPRALVAQNDLGLGQVVDEISHSPVWGSTAIFVVEDDSQNGADHYDAHRIPALVISPYARAGAVVHTRYDFPSVIRSMELILGLRPLGLMDALATPMYDAFSPSPQNASPYDARPAQWDLLERNPPLASAARRSIGHGRFPGIDEIPQQRLDAELWRSVHGLRSRPPPPGPDANPGE